MKRLLRNNTVVIAFLFLLVSCLIHYRVFTAGVLLLPAPDEKDYPIKHLYSYALKNFEFPLWDPYEFIGFPYVADIERGSLYPINIVLYSVFPAPYAFNLSTILHLALAGYFTFLYVRLIGMGVLPAFMAGIVFGFAGFNLTYKYEAGTVNSAAYLPLIMYFLERLRRAPELKYALAAALLSATQILAGNFQVYLYTFIVVVFFAFFHGFRETEKRIRFLVLMLVCIVLGLLIALPQVLATKEAVDVSWRGNTRIYRGYDFMSLYHVYLETLPSLFFQRLFDGWGPKDAVSVLIGTLPLALALVAAVKERRDSRVRFWSIVGAAGLLFSLGSDIPLNRLFYHVPLINSFRVQAMHLLEFTFAVSVLFAIGLNMLLGEQKRRTYIRLSAVFLFSLLVLSIMAVSAIPLLPESVIEHLRQRDFQKPDYLRELSLSRPELYIPLMAALLYLSLILLLRVRIAFKYALPAVLLVEALYLPGYGKANYPLMDDYHDMCKAESYSALVAGGDDVVRLANIFRVDSDKLPSYLANLTCRVGSINADDSLMNNEYADLLELWHFGYYTHRWKELVRNNVILSMLGVKYINVSKDAGLDVAGVKAIEEHPQRERINIGIGTEHTLSGVGDSVSGVCALSEGIYVISLRARAGGSADGPLTAWLLPSSGESAYSYSVWDRFRRDYVLDKQPGRYAKKVLEAIPDYIGEEPREFIQVFSIDKPDLFIFKLISSSKKPIDVAGVSLERLDGYSPPAMTAPVGEDVYRKLIEDKDYAVYLNKNALPLAWSVGSLLPVEDFMEVKRKLVLLEVNPARVAMIYRDDIGGLKLDGLSAGDVSIERNGMNEVLLKAKFPDAGFVVLSEQYYPGWRAFIDGRETKIYRVNGVIRGVPVPGGEHSISFRYRPRRITALMGLSLALSLSALAYLAIKR